MRQPKRHFIQRTGTAVYLDATISTVKECRGGCAHDTNYACVHRFGPQVYVIGQQSRISFTRLSDLQVILDFLHIILNRWKDGTKGVWNRRHIILTNDRRFLQHAERSFRHQQNMRALPLQFRANGVTYVTKGYPWEVIIEVHVLPRALALPSDSLHDAIAYAQSLPVS